MLNGNHFLYKKINKELTLQETMNNRKRVGIQTAGINISLCLNMILCQCVCVRVYVLKLKKT